MATYHKQLEGISANPSLLDLYEECVLACKSEVKPLLTAVSTDSSDGNSPQKASSQSPKTNAVVLSPLSLENAVTSILEFQDQTNANNLQVFPLSIIRAINVVIQSLDNDNNNNSNKTVQLEEALRQTQLAFTPPPNEDPSHNKKFQERMERLRLKNEESKYYRLTANIAGNQGKGDDITTKSMTYAASIGLNMIVAPISFGVFMFFFSGPILNFLFQRVEPTHPGAVDIRKVIIGVISGVAMLFIEMLLFVIRTHEFDRGMAKKQKKAGTGVKPFGAYSAKTDKTFQTDKNKMK